MQIKHKIDAFLTEVFPELGPKPDPALVVEAMTSYYTYGPYKPKVEVKGDEVIVEVDTNTIEVQGPMYKKAIALCDQGKFNEAEPILKELIAGNPSISEYHRILGQITSEKGNQDQAINHLIDALKWDPKNGWALLMMGNIFARHKNDIDTAIKYYDQAIVQNSEDPIGLTNAAYLTLKQNRPIKAEDYIDNADYLLAAYAATLKILTSYEKIGDINVEYELSKPRDGKNIGPVETIINNAIRTAYDYLIPQAFDSFIWKNLSAEERFFIKGMELEKSNVYQLGAYQEMARGFGVKEFKEMLFSTKANQVRFKIPSEFGNRGLGNADAFGNTLLRQVLMSIAQSEKEQNGQTGRAWLKNEVEDYWNKRQTIIELLKYFSTTEHINHMQHWESPSTYAKYLVELISNDGV